MNNGMQESLQSFVSWPHVAEHTFKNFTEFAYTGNFKIIQPRDKEPSDGNEETEKTTDDESEDEKPEGAASTAWLTQYAEIMVFADYYAVDDLLVLAHSKLERVFSAIPSDRKKSASSAALQAVPEFCRYCYSHDVPGLLQDLIYTLLQKHAAVLWENEAF